MPGGLNQQGGDHRPGPTTSELATCDREPIHIPGSIQPHGVLLVLDQEQLSVVQASENTDHLLGIPVHSVLGCRLESLLEPDLAEWLTTKLSRISLQNHPILLGSLGVEVTGIRRNFQAVAHRIDRGIILELEVVPPGSETIDHYAIQVTFTERAEKAGSISELARATSEVVRQLTGFDRVLVYQFDDDWNGFVIGEDRNDRLPSLLDHRFPASDIPAQARELYRTNRLRLIADAAYQPVPLVPDLYPGTGEPLDLSFAVLRSVSPVHVEYMKNMQTAASMSVSILRDGRLWGLLSCHHGQPRAIPFSTRSVCDLIARGFSLRLTALEHTQDHVRRLEVRLGYAKLLVHMADRLDFAAAFAEHPEELLAIAGATGAAVLTEGSCLLLGQTPAEKDARRIADWLFDEVDQEVYATDSLATNCPWAETLKDRASGLMAISVSKLHPSYVLWFRPEAVRTIKWGGDPHKSAEVDSETGRCTRLHPRRSFATWMETVRLRSLPWRPSEVEAAADLRNVIVGVVLKKAEELAELNAELTRSNRELEAFSYSVSHDLRAPLRHVVGYAEILRENAADRLTEVDERYIRTIIESSEFAGTLVDKLLAFSRLGRGELHLVQVDMNQLVAEVQREVAANAVGRTISWRVAPLPRIQGDLVMIRLAILNLLDNAIKYTRGRAEAVIEVGCRDEGDEIVFFVRDNGVGFDMRYADKLFGIFQRLHRMEDYEGTGIGLANVRRIISRHGGRTWAEGEEGRGATFFFSLSRPPG